MAFRLGGRGRAQKLGGFLASVLLLVGCDQGTKQVAKQRLESGPPHVLLEAVLDLRYAENTDVGFNLLRGLPLEARRPLILGLATLTLVGFSTWALRERKVRTIPPRHPVSSLAAPWRLPLVLFFAGALGNLVDRVFRGYVIDFVHISHWPVFNVADAYLTVAIALLAIGLWPRRPKQDAAMVR